MGVHDDDGRITHNFGRLAIALFGQFGQMAAGNPLSAAYFFDFFVLAADANRDRTVDVRDLYILSQNWLGSGKTFSQGDFNYDTLVNKLDLTIIAQVWQVTLAEPAQPGPAQETGAARRAPTRTPTRVASDILR